MPNRVVILGCGPSGLAAAKAAIDSGYRVLIASHTDEPSTQYGCQYLHAPIPGYEGVAHTTVSYHLNGTTNQYRLKVYGSKWPGRVSPEDFIGDHDAWDIRETYRRMWQDLHHHPLVGWAKTIPIHTGFIPSPVYDYNPDYIISTIPATELCYFQGHTFQYHAIYASGSTSPYTAIEDEIICDGTTDHDWYRISRVFGYSTIEWSSEPKNGETAVRVRKPLKTDCDCTPSTFRVGRYGKWEKGYLVHQVYPEVTSILK